MKRGERDMNVYDHSHTSFILHNNTCLQTLKHTLHLCSPPPSWSSPLNHQIQYIILSIGPIEFPLLLLNELVLRESAGNEGPAAPELHFCCSAIYSPQFSHCFMTNCISQSALLPALALSSVSWITPITLWQQGDCSFSMSWSDWTCVRGTLKGRGVTMDSHPCLVPLLWASRSSMF